MFNLRSYVYIDEGLMGMIDKSMMFFYLQKCYQTKSSPKNYKGSCTFSEGSTPKVKSSQRNYTKEVRISAKSAEV